LLQEDPPYDPQWEPYFEKRWERQWKTKHPSTLKTIWLKQNGLCSACQGRLGEEDELDTHHLKLKTLGGTDTLDNLVLLHSTCHKQVHYFHGKEASPVLYGALSKAEPCAGKLACTVLRGLSDGDITQLPDPCCLVSGCNSSRTTWRTASSIDC
jgi:hypothetical protein